jgi:hypothetical protein
MPKPAHKPVRLELGSFKPKAAAPVTPEQERQGIAQARQQGFTSRGNGEKIDGRKLRRKGKIQMNMRVSEHVRSGFLQISMDFADADACLARLIELYRASKAGRP